MGVEAIFVKLCARTVNAVTMGIRPTGFRGGSRFDCRGGLSIQPALARAKFYVLRPLLTSFPHTTCYTKKK